jgi:hypothetical protein
MFLAGVNGRRHPLHFGEENLNSTHIETL